MRKLIVIFAALFLQGCGGSSEQAYSYQCPDETRDIMNKAIASCVAGAWYSGKGCKQRANQAFCEVLSASEY